MTYKTIKYWTEDDIAILMLAQPPQNVMNSLFFKELLDICESEIIKQKFKGLIITGEGRHFSSGADIIQLAEVIKSNQSSGIPEVIKNNLKSFKLLSNLRKPSLAVIKGACLGSGFELALCTKYRVVTKNALLSLPESSFGLMPGLGGNYNLKNIIGAGNTLDVILGEKVIDADESIRLGLADLIADKNHIMKIAIEKIKATQCPCFTK